MSGCRLRTRACCLVRQWVHEAVGRLSHIFHVKEALVSCAFFLRAPYIWQSLRRCSCVSSWRHVEEVHTISSSSFHRTRQMCLQLRAARSFAKRLPLVSALKVVLTSGRCKICWSWRVPVGFALKVVWTTGRCSFRAAAAEACRVGSLDTRLCSARVFGIFLGPAHRCRARRGHVHRDMDGSRNQMQSAWMNRHPC